ncbi:MAG: hypothetical protein GJU76_09355 [Gallionella sp.]|nr:hypothetical protein [Gallionella sp.]
MTTPFEGTNLDYSGVAEPYGETSVMNAVTSLAPGTIRYPGGAISNYWDWQTGTVNQPPATQQKQPGGTKTVPARHRTYRFTLSTLKQITTASGAVPIFDLNVMTSTMQDQLQMLRTAAQMGIPVRYVELGNEFYLPISNYVQAFPTATSYANLVASWAPAIRAAFPNAQVAAVASVSTATPREQSWNSTLLSIAGNDINAVTFHDYQGTRTSANTPPSPATLLAGASIDWQPVDNIINSLPSHLSVWLTEYNLSLGDRAEGSPALGTTWEHGLYVAGLDMEELASPRVTLTDYWDLFGNARDAQFTAATPPVATPTGSASQLINQAMKGAVGITVLTIANDPVLDGSVKSVSGIKVTAAWGGDRLILVNLGSSSATLAASKVIPTGASVQQLSGSLSMQAVNLQSRHVSSDLTLPSYSVTVVSM